MTKSEIIVKLAARTGHTKKDTAAFLDCFLNILCSGLACGETVKVGGLGSFRVKICPSRRCGLPSNKDLMLPAHYMVSFKSAKRVRRALARQDPFHILTPPAPTDPDPDPSEGENR